jgi:hypothetical protein
MRNMFLLAAVLPLGGAYSAALRGNVRGGDPGADMYSYHAAPQGGAQDPGGGGGGGGMMPPMPGGIGGGMGGGIGGGMGGGIGGGMGANGGINYGSAEAPGGVSPAKTNADGSIAYPSAYKDVREAAVMSEQFQSGALQAAIAGDQRNGIVDDSAETMQNMALQRQMAATQAMRKSTNGVMKMSSLMQNHDASYSDVLSAVDWMSTHDGDGKGGGQHLYRNDHQSAEDVRKQGQYDAAAAQADSVVAQARAGAGVDSKSGWNAGETPMTRAAAAAAGTSSPSNRPKSDSGSNIISDHGDATLSASAVMQSMEAQRSASASAAPPLNEKNKKKKRETKAEKKLDRTLEKLKADLQAAENIHPEA